MKIKQKLTWFLFLCFGILILIINNSFKINIFKNFIEEVKELLRKNSQYIEDGDYRLIKKKKK